MLLSSLHAGDRLRFGWRTGSEAYAYGSKIRVSVSLVSSCRMFLKNSARRTSSRQECMEGWGWASQLCVTSLKDMEVRSERKAKDRVVVLLSSWICLFHIKLFKMTPGARS